MVSYVLFIPYAPAKNGECGTSPERDQLRGTATEEGNQRKWKGGTTTGEGEGSEVCVGFTITACAKLKYRMGGGVKNGHGGATSVLKLVAGSSLAGISGVRRSG